LNESIYQLLESDHRELDELMDEAFSAIRSADKDLAYSRLDLFWARLAMHIRAEHVRLFPALRHVAERSGRADTLELLTEMRHDHDFFMRELARAIKAMRLVFHFGNEAETFETVTGILVAVRDRLALHNRIEEEKIYPLVNPGILSDTDAEQVVQAVRKELDNYPQRLAGGAAGP
jgi:iron-sulfur cluster repair protein YtfE (RIC family)